jgi:putative ABC transport system substrate-binding protein
MDRRSFLGTLAGGLLAGPLAAEAQQTGRMYRIGYLGEGTPENALVLEETLRELGYLGYVEGRNLVVERRFAAFKYDRLPDLAAELVRLKPDVLVTGGNPGIAALRQATATVPIVMAWASDPVGAGLVTRVRVPIHGRSAVNVLRCLDDRLGTASFRHPIIPVHLGLLLDPTRTGLCTETRRDTRVA